MDDVGHWFRNLPTMTRVWFGSTVGLSLISWLGLISPYSLALHHEPLFRSFQLWRPVTSLFCYPINPSTGFHFLILLYFLYSYSLRLETGFFVQRPADYLFMLLFCWVNCVIASLLGGIMFLMDSMVAVVLYVWCQLNKDLIVTFWFGTTFKAMYLPWVFLGFTMITSGRGMLVFIGILVGHLYFFLMFKYPQDFGGATLLRTPQILYDYFPNYRENVYGFGQAPTARRSNDDGGTGGRGIFRGQGHTLG
ncbi:derlin-1 [Panulirus ornatus]|uniref:derlin-1 n=1 Tax=Panulirus ornatus TaxID=150431 RepID=UPI003A84726A